MQYYDIISYKHETSLTSNLPADTRAAAQGQML